MRACGRLTAPGTWPAAYASRAAHVDDGHAVEVAVADRGPDVGGVGLEGQAGGEVAGGVGRRGGGRRW